MRTHLIDPMPGGSGGPVPARRAGHPRHGYRPALKSLRWRRRRRTRCRIRRLSWFRFPRAV